MLTKIFPWPYRLLAVLALIAALAGAAYLQGRRHEQDSQLRGQVDSVLRVVRIERAQLAISNQVAAAHEQGRAADRIVYKAIEREVVRYVANPDHDVCELDRGWVQLHDTAALSRIPDPAGVADATSSGLTADDALGAVVDNYGACQDNARQLADLQGWVRAQQELSDTPLPVGLQ
ncbi:hypothetical protein [Chitinimonas taiwanensis]|uniref:hypothetical protein n=1 Tax=Chitinimonas taiwanensis TaxID=240412 RepID=UPI0035B30EB5